MGIMAPIMSGGGMELVGSYSFASASSVHFLNELTAQQFYSIISNVAYDFYFIHIYSSVNSEYYDYIFPPISFDISSNQRFTLTHGGYSGKGDFTVNGVGISGNNANKVVFYDGLSYGTVTMKLYRIKI